MRTNATSTWLERFSILERFSLAVFFVVATTRVLAAQTATAAQALLEDALMPGMTVWITDSAGQEVRARVTGVSSGIVTTTIGAETRQVPTAEIVRVRARRSDPLLNGALIGAGAAVASGLALCRLTEPWENCRDDVGPMLRIGAIGAGAGIAIDALIRGRRTIYEAPGSARIQVSPLIGRHVGGLHLSLDF
jgi:hypothetical protein